MTLNEHLLYQLADPMHHRGPDDHGWCALTSHGVALDYQRHKGLPYETALVHRRLSILDLTEAGRQPMGTPDGRYFIVYNGQIYNFLELRSELQSLGYRFGSRSDTEALLNGYVQWGLRILQRVIGMFAFAILDVAARKLLLVRDFFGIKPLYYACWQDGFAFSSELKPLLSLPGVSREVNPQLLYEYLRSGLTDHGGETLFAGIHQLPAAHYLELSLDLLHCIQPRRYWEMDLCKRCEISFAQAAEELRELFLESVRLHLRRDVTVGAALSGGIDSSSIVMAMRRLNPGQDIQAFSHLAEDPKLNEERWVDIIGDLQRFLNTCCVCIKR